MSPALSRVRSHASGASSSALLHGVGAVTMGAAMLAEDHAGYRFPVFDGPRAILTFAPDPITAWGALFLILGALTLGWREAGARVSLVLIAGAWATFAGGALVLGITSADAAVAGGLAWLIVAADAARAALEYAPRSAAAVAAAAILAEGQRDHAEG